jgi:hypothetical protein
MKRLVLLLVVVASLAVPGIASAACRSGIAQDGEYSGYVPYYVGNSFVQLRTTVRNMNVLGVVFMLDVSTYSSSHVQRTFWLLPGQSGTIVGPTYTTPFNNTKGVPYTLFITAYSDAIALAYQVCT